jgi:5,10-methylene-tetrahydrofolate dehydrogenase/methenyl tetrahydrofolate cyclohydrolase
MAGAELIDGKAIAKQIRQELKEQVAAMAPSIQPGLAVILVGSRRDSQTYVNMKTKACAQVGIASFGYDYDESVMQEELLAKIEELNNDDKVHGILVQLPLPSHINEKIVLNAVSPDKDVDGLHPENVAKLATQDTHRAKSVSSEESSSSWSYDDLSSLPFSVPCTPLGCLELLDRSGVDIAGKHAVVVGRSDLVGLPLSFLLLHRDATVTVVHSKSKSIESIVSQADIVIAAVGKAGLIKGDWIKEGAVVIDVGINSVDLPPEEVQEGKKPYKLVGDCDFESCSQKASKITPVPGGVGPMTIAMLLRNTVNACQRSITSSASSPHVVS